MKILALDSTAKVASVALCEDEHLLGELTLNNGNTHSQTLLPMVEFLLDKFELSPSDVDLFAVAAGPGSFTGVRIGAATVKGLAFGKETPCAGVSTLESLAYNLCDYDGLICPVMNARRQQVYTALFRAKDGVLERLMPDSAIAITDLDQRLSVFDEPEAGIDLWSFQNLIKVFEKMYEKNRGSILIISHQERILDIADKIIVLKAGKIDKIGTKDEIMPALLGVDKGCRYVKED